LFLDNVKIYGLHNDSSKFHSHKVYYCIALFVVARLYTEGTTQGNNGLHTIVYGPEEHPNEEHGIDTCEQCYKRFQIRGHQDTESSP